MARAAFALRAPRIPFFLFDCASSSPNSSTASPLLLGPLTCTTVQWKWKTERILTATAYSRALSLSLPPSLPPSLFAVHPYITHNFCFQLPTTQLPPYCFGPASTSARAGARPAFFPSKTSRRLAIEPAKPLTTAEGSLCSVLRTSITRSITRSRFQATQNCPLSAFD